MQSPTLPSILPSAIDRWSTTTETELTRSRIIADAGGEGAVLKISARKLDLLRVSSVSVVVLHLSMADGKIEGRVGLCTNPLITIRYHVAQVSLTHRQHASFSGAIFLKEKNFPPENCSHGSKELIERSPKPCHLQKSEERIKRYMGSSKFNASTSFH